MAARLNARVTSAGVKPGRDARKPDRPRRSSTATVTHAPMTVITLLGQLSDAMSLITVVHRSLMTHESAGVGDEEVALRHALELLHAAYSALDQAPAGRVDENPPPSDPRRGDPGTERLRQRKRQGDR